MADQPWKAQPTQPPAAEPSRIIRPVDTIVIDIDNRRNPATVNMRPSRELPIPFVINIFSNLISQLSAQLAQAMAGAAPPAKPPTEPPAGSNGGLHG